MGKLSRLRPRETSRVYCPNVRRNVEVTKWSSGIEGDVIVCQEPWIENENSVRPRYRSERPYNRVGRRSCGYDRRCSVLDEIFLAEKSGKKEQKLLNERIDAMLKDVSVDRRISGLLNSARQRLFRKEYLMMDYYLSTALDCASPGVRNNVMFISVNMRRLYNIKNPEQQTYKSKTGE